MMTDPVCNMQLDEKAVTHSLVFENETFFFCSEGCQAEFLRHPPDYLMGDHRRPYQGSEEHRDV